MMDSLDASWMDDEPRETVKLRPIRRSTNQPKYSTTAEDAERARAERIAYRRERIANKMAVECAESEPDEAEVESVASSVELLTARRGADKAFQPKPVRGFRRSTAVGQPVTASTASMQARAAASSAARLHAGAGGMKGSAVALGSANATAKDHLETQLEQTRKQLEQLLLDGETLVTNVKVAAEYRERARQDDVKRTKKERLAKLKDEAKDCQDAYKQIEEQWFISAEKVLPLELYETIQKQQLNCDKLLDRKQELIDDMQMEMEENDVEYENDLDIYQNDIMLMGDRIDDHIDSLRAAFMEELQLIEEFTAHDRELLLEQNQKEWMELLEKFESSDKNATEDRKKGALDRFNKLGELYSGTREEANKIKEALKDDFRTLQLELEHIKMAALINLEKLEYNLEVLRRREVENLAMKNAMKRYLLKLQDKFNEKVQQYKTQIAKAHRDNERIIKDIRRLEYINGEAGKKMLHLITLDFQTYMDLWIYNEAEAREKLERLHGSEKLIFETQFGLKLADMDMGVFDDRPAEIHKFIKRKERGQRKLLGVDEDMFPNKMDVSDYWDRFLLLLDPRHVDWNTVMYCFAEYNKVLKIRNQYVEEVGSLYQENMELSFLLKKHVQGNARQCFGPQIANNPPYC